MQLHRKKRPLHLDEHGSLDISHLGYHPLHHLHHYNVKQLEMLLLKLQLRIEVILALLAAINKKYIALSVAAATSLLFGTYLYAFTRPVSMQMAYSGGALCEDALTVLPSLHSTTSDTSSYQLSMERPFKLGGVTLFSRAVCATPTEAPQEDSNQSLEVAPFGSGLFAKQVTIQNETYPSITSSFQAEQKISHDDTLQFELSRPDEFFTYELMANEASTLCSVSGATLSCNLAELKLEQSKTYAIELIRSFNGQVYGSAYTTELTTNDALQVTGVSIENEATVYEKLGSVTVSFSEPLSAVADLTLTDGSGTPVEGATTFDGTTATITFSNELARSTTFTLTVSEATSTTNASLRAPFTTQFTTSGGPIVLGSNSANYGFDRASAITVRFDSPLRNSADALSKFSIVAGNTEIPVSVSISGNTAVVDPVQLLPWCTTFTIRIADGLVSEYGVADGTGKNLNGRTICYTTELVGLSKNGRAITAFKFGSGAERIVFVGGTHGDEQSSVYILNSWIDNLDANIGNIPSNRSVYVIPNINPDGFAVGGRVNANGIDLNRNFPANNWKRDVIMPSGVLNVGGGGANPLSEPESSALASYVLNLNPELVLTYHATGGLAISNESGDSTSLAQTYANMVGYTGLTNSNIAGIFSHDITGAFEDWLHDAHGIPAILIELWTTGGNEINSHSEAMWHMVRH